MRKKFLFFSLAALAAFNFMSCDDEDENNNGDNTTNNGGGTTTSNLSAEFVGASDCQGSPFDDETRAGDQSNGPRIVYKYDSSKGEVELNLEDAVFNCAAQPKMVVTFSGDTIIFTPYVFCLQALLQTSCCLRNFPGYTGQTSPIACLNGHPSLPGLSRYCGLTEQGWSAE